MTTDDKTLAEQIETALNDQHGWTEPPADYIAAAVLPIIRKAQADAWQAGVNFALPGKETYWISKHNPHRATGTGDSDEHR